MLHKKLSLAALSLCVMFSGCAIKLKPDLVAIAHDEKTPVVRLGEITETLTGTWKVYPQFGFKDNLVKALNASAPSSRFSNSLSNVTLSIHLTSDHEDDAPRLTSLGTLSMVTLGIIPLSYHSEWKVDCEVKLHREDGTLVGSYNLSEVGTYDIQVYPLTMLSLSGAGIRGDSDGLKIADRIASSLALKITKIIDENYNEFARYAGKSTLQVTPQAVQSAPSVLVT